MDQTIIDVSGLRAEARGMLARLDAAPDVPLILRAEAVALATRITATLIRSVVHGPADPRPTSSGSPT